MDINRMFGHESVIQRQKWAMWPEDVTVLIGIDVEEVHDLVAAVKSPAGTAGPIAFQTPFGWGFGGQTVMP
ncbi:hypothetical protein OUZ56_033231 [Daphnia magna]|uniref:Uncharacterized protein n=1 Tax=Daphnia magna TaxID=35525 RepID=A0ABQ9ZXG3_9CRUS|nr:hypothetical protein OUZ56_033231 [Daphnia magna]